MLHPWLAERMSRFDASGIRKLFDLAAKLKDPINLSIGQPHFDVPPAAKRAAIEAIESGKNGYAPTQGIPPLLERLQARVDREFKHRDRKVFVTSGTSGGLAVALLALVNPGDEVIVFDPYFVMYPAVVAMMGGRCVSVDTYPDFRIDLKKVAQAITPRTKAILVNSPANPTGAVMTEAEVRGLAELAAERNVALVSDEIYKLFSFDGPALSPAQFNDRTIVVEGFSKTYGMTGWRLGFAHGPSEIIDAMIKTQQFTFVCSPQPVQWAGLAAMDIDMSGQIAAYRQKRDMVCRGLRGVYDLVEPRGAFYAFPRVPSVRGKQETGAQFVERAIEKSLILIPGHTFSRQDTHFRISFAVEDAMLARGVEALRALAR
ncbi:MAG: aminotransferase class I/II-fold pyridoxal phosphate-dependent enzyme [Planctomycetia bacterium]|nr:aminotransferase class I/II-fold pyridoxal phosphate-dependent enzyme [Planctomycetia bacterium]